jgi:hypothetical protein
MNLREMLDTGSIKYSSNFSIPTGMNWARHGFFLQLAQDRDRLSLSPMQGDEWGIEWGTDGPTGDGWFFAAC